MNERHFTASWSTTLRVLTLFFGGLLLLLPIVLWSQERPESPATVLPLFVVPWAILLGSLAFVTDSSNLVVLRFASRTVVVSPDRPADFLEAVQPESGVMPPGSQN